MTDTQTDINPSFGQKDISIKPVLNCYFATYIPAIIPESSPDRHSVKPNQPAVA